MLKIKMQRIVGTQDSKESDIPSSHRERKQNMNCSIRLSREQHKVPHWNYFEEKRKKSFTLQSLLMLGMNTTWEKASAILNNQQSLCKKQSAACSASSIQWPTTNYQNMEQPPKSDLPRVSTKSIYTKCWSKIKKKRLEEHHYLTTTVIISSSSIWLIAIVWGTKGETDISSDWLVNYSLGQKKGNPVLKISVSCTSISPLTTA